MSHPEQFKRVQTEAHKLFCEKNKDYSDAFADYGIVGVLVRLGDRIRRAQSISNNSVVVVQSESFRDTLIDLHNYAAMGVMLLDSARVADGTEMGEDSSGSESDDSDTETVIKQCEIKSAEWHVAGKTYTVTRYDSGRITCECPWYQYHPGEECKHIKKAVQLQMLHP